MSGPLAIERLRQARAELVEAMLDRSIAKLSLALKLWKPDQPRAPAGSSEGGQWVSYVGQPQSAVRQPGSRVMLASNGIADREHWIRIDINNNIGFYRINSGTMAIVDFGHRTPPSALSIDSPLIQAAPINANDNFKLFSMSRAPMTALNVRQPNFTLSTQAMDRIMELARIREHTIGKRVMPCIALLETRYNAWLPQSVPVIGFYGPSEYEPDAVVAANGLDFVYAVNDKGYQEFAGRTLMYGKDGFFLS